MHKQKSSYSLEEIIQCGEGKLFGPGNAQLPLPPMLMFSEITKISRYGDKNNSGQIIAELSLTPDLWFFNCHFKNDPVMPGCLGLDAMWQLLGFYLAWLGRPGKGRALGGGEIKFSGQVTTSNKLLTYQVDVTRVIFRDFTMGIADAHMECDGKIIYVAKNLKVGLFQQSIDKSAASKETASKSGIMV